MVFDAVAAAQVLCSLAIHRHTPTAESVIEFSRNASEAALVDLFQELVITLVSVQQNELEADNARPKRS